MAALAVAMALGCFGQTVTAPVGTAPVATTPCAAGSTPAYSYFASAGISRDLYGQSTAVSTGFGVKTGQCSNAFIVTTINTGVNMKGLTNTYSTLSVAFEYHIARSGYFEFNGDGVLGGAQITSTNGSVTQAMFGGGVSLGYDLAGALTKGKVHVPVVFHADYLAITATQVRPELWVDFRKTF
jgi:hypothetical protein